MDKTFAFGATAVVGAIFGIYYAGPASSGDLDTPPLLVDSPPAQVLSRIRATTMQQYLLHAGAGDAAGKLVRLKREAEGDGEAIGSIWIGSDRVAVIHARAETTAGGQTELDIVAEFPDSRLTAQPALLPYDRKVLAAVTDLAVTDYYSSLLNGKRMARNDEKMKMIVNRIGWDRDQWEAFTRRFGEAFSAAYGRDIKSAMANRAASRDFGFGLPMDHTIPADPGRDSAAIYQAEEMARQREERARERLFNGD